MIFFVVDYLKNRLGSSDRTLISLRENFDMTGPTGRLMLTIVSAVSQMELELTRERCRCALQAKKLLAQQTGIEWRCGRPPVKKELAELVIKYHQQGMSMRKIELMLNHEVSRSTASKIIRAFKKRLEMK